jgi:hypothetical protein
MGGFDTCVGEEERISTWIIEEPREAVGSHLLYTSQLHILPRAAL